MSEITIANMPEEVLDEIFKWLDPGSLKDAVLTSQYWNGVIERNIPWSLSLKCWNDGNLVMASNRKFHKVVISGMRDLDSNRTLEFFTKHGGNIREPSLFDNSIDNATIWCQVLETMTKLKIVVMKGNIVFGIEKISDDLLPSLQKLPQLKTLEMIESSAELLKYFQNCQLQTLKFLCSRKYNQPREPLLNFLATQKDLEVLALRSFDYGISKLFELPIPVDFIPFKLKKLSLQGVNLRKSPNEYNNLMELMKLHVKTLEELELGRTFPDFFFEFVFAQFKKLKTLSLMECTIPRDVGFFERLQEISSVTNLQLTGDANFNFIAIFSKKLQLTGEDTSSDTSSDNSSDFWSETSSENSSETSSDSIAFAIKQLVSHLPNIESLSLLGYFDNSIAKYIAENLFKLKNLTVSRIFSDTFDDVKFEALQSLRILNITGLIDWDAFTKANPGIIDFSIKNVYNLDMRSLTANLKLRKLAIGDYKMNCDESFFNVIRENCPQLKSLDLHAIAKKVDISTVADIPGLRFRDDDYFFEQYQSEGNFWDQADYNGGFPADRYNWTGEAAGIDLGGDPVESGGATSRDSDSCDWDRMAGINLSDDDDY